MDISILLDFWIAFFVIITVIMNFGIIVLILRNREQANNRITWYLIGTIVSISIWIITVFLQIEYFTFEDNLLTHTIIASISNIVILFGLTLMAGFAKLLVEPIVSIVQMSILFGLSGLVAGIYMIIVYLATQNESDYVNTASIIKDLINFTIIILVIFFIQSDLRILLKEPLSKKQENQIKLVNRSLLIGLIGILPIIILASFYGDELLAIAFVIISIALYFLINAYLIDPRVAFILPYRTYLVIIVNDSGVLRYSRDFMGDRDLKSTLLISSALSAIVSLMSEFYNTDVVPTMVKFQDRLILFSISNDYFMAVFTDRDSVLIRSAMSNTIKEINEKYTSLDHKLDIPIDLNDIFDRTFYFIY